MSEERWREYLKLVYSDTLTEKDMERMFLVNPADAFAIYQLRDHESTHDLRLQTHLLFCVIQIIA